MAGPSFSSLPEATVAHIFTFLELPDLFGPRNCAFVCKFWHHIISTQPLLIAASLPNRHTPWTDFIFRLPEHVLLHVERFECYAHHRDFNECFADSFIECRVPRMEHFETLRPPRPEDELKKDKKSSCILS
eukprot:TRINITY_DN16929_c0_g1_i2.p1 TRINITY_DN16929_c0_g1~~TRINITY_DN16929_c0_g1_i2.p1  ORF type:complete len:131 (-),score=14.47 TRINITY_DN16929_c0_g1_i2:122-514(-)